MEECDISNSEDASIRNVIPINIRRILCNYPHIKLMGITGNKASSLFDKFLKDKVGTKVVYLPPTSSANVKISDEELINKYKELFK